MTGDPRNWRRFYGLGAQITSSVGLRQAQMKYLQQYERMDAKDPKRVAASAALLYGLAEYTRDIGYGLPIPFVEGLHWTAGTNATTRAGRQLAIERHMEAARNRSTGSFKKPSLLTKFRVKAKGFLDPPIHRAQHAYYLMSHLDMMNERRIKASEALLRMVAKAETLALPGNFVYGMGQLLHGSANRLSKPELRQRVEKASRGYYNWKNRTASAGKVNNAHGLAPARKSNSVASSRLSNHLVTKTRNNPLYTSAHANPLHRNSNSNKTLHRSNSAASSRLSNHRLVTHANPLYTSAHVNPMYRPSLSRSSSSSGSYRSAMSNASSASNSYRTAPSFKSASSGSSFKSASSGRSASSGSSASSFKSAVSRLSGLSGLFGRRR